ncbi:hypothetical protein LO762_00535 [Actinocorallia sp. API 0066]|uniref:hypothetical protein n=1 Tax=Actinocorallia sp. API 0066 TaxID=2896846 RepID=UPI001E539CB9|nr:hypothetical protein [Actinocorallia sp. API 0066]MCD0447688.1 hypothetical protein [Actinocorallia sp. API 0066]
MSPFTSVLLAAALPLGSGGDPQVAFSFQDARITESSGLAASQRHPGIVYTHNDSGGLAQVFAVEIATGRTKAVLTLDGITARDWEGMALGRDEQGRPALFLGDIGDNLRGAWPHVAVFRIPEPARLRDATLPVTAFRFTYEDGPRDAESLLIDPRDNRLYIASKQLGSGTLYRAPKKLSTSAKNVLRPVGPAHSFATDGAFSPDGSTFVIRGYGSATLYKAPGERIDRISLPNQEQGEGITYTADGKALLISSEGADRKVWRVPLPDDALPQPSPAETAENASGDSDTTGTNKGVGLFVLAGVLLAAVVFGRRRK